MSREWPGVCCNMIHYLLRGFQGFVNPMMYKPYIHVCLCTCSMSWYFVSSSFSSTITCQSYITLTFLTSYTYSIQYHCYTATRSLSCTKTDEWVVFGEQVCTWFGCLSPSSIRISPSSIRISPSSIRISPSSIWISPCSASCQIRTPPSSAG